MSSPLEILISFVIIAIALIILTSGVLTASRNYEEMEKRYLAVLTAENVLHAIAADSDVPDSMNGFHVSYERTGEKLVVHVGKWRFEYEVSF